MTLLVVSPDYASHLLPLVALAEAWARAGDRVVVATGDAVAPIVRRFGFQQAPLVLGRGSNPGVIRTESQPAGEDENLRAFFAATRRGMTATLSYQAEARRSDLLWNPETTAQATLRIVDAVRPDAILADHLAFAATLALRSARLSYGDVVLGHPTALPVGDEVYGVPADWPRAFRPDPADLMSLRLRCEAVRDEFTETYNRALRRLAPGANPVPDAFAAHGDVVLLNYPAVLHDAKRSALLPAAHVYLGSAVRTEQPPPDVARWLAQPGSRPIVYVSFGSFLSERADVLSRVAEGLRDLDVRVALATGSADPLALGPLPEDWLVRPYLPQVAILRQAAAAVTHGGNNSVTESLSFGVPMLVLPFSTDQFAAAAAVERRGVGSALDPNRASAGEIAAACLRLLSGPEKEAAAMIERELLGDPGPGRARRALLGAAAPTGRTFPA